MCYFAILFRAYSDAEANRTMSVVAPKVSLLEGAKVLETVLAPKEFHFQFRGHGKSSGGNYASGELIIVR